MEINGEISPLFKYLTVLQELIGSASTLLHTDGFILQELYSKCLDGVVLVQIIVGTLK